MKNLEINLKKRLEALFENETKKQLIETANQVFKEIKQQKKQNTLENLKEKLSTVEKTLEQMTDKLLIVGNKALADFENEISTVKEPERKNAIEQFQEMITSKIQELVKSGTINKFHE